MTGSLGDPAGLQVSLDIGADRVRVVLSGDIDCRSAPILGDLLHLTVGGGTPVVEVDVAQVQFIDVAGLRVLTRARYQGAQRGVALILRRPSSHVVWLLQVTGTAVLLGGDNLSEGGTSAVALRSGLIETPDPPGQDSPGGQSSICDWQADERDRRADERDRRAGERELLAEDMRRLDEERSRLLDERHQKVVAQQQWEDIREDVANEREKALEQRERDC